MRPTSEPQSALVPATLWVSMDEPAYYLIESNLQSPGSRGWRRYQRIWVIRNDAVAEWKKDLGAAANFTAPGFGIPGGVTDEQTGHIEVFHTVGELVDIADAIRAGQIEQPHVEPSDLIGSYNDEYDKRRKWRKRQTTFGHGGWTQRNY